MVGAFGVGKTSLVSRFVSSVFSDKYLSTVGAKVDKKTLTAAGQDVMLMLWDLAGEDDSTKVNMTYLRGSAGYLLVMDRTRRATLDSARLLSERITKEIGRLPFVAVVNKADVAEGVEIATAELGSLTASGWTVLETSAKSGQNVDAAFTKLAEMLLAGG